jgi:hypothetical protein
MALNYAKLFNRRITPQSRPVPGSTQVANSGGGYSWQVNDWTRFDRFLILGAEGGTYYIGERDLVKQNHDAIVRCIKTDGVRAVKATRRVEAQASARNFSLQPHLSNERTYEIQTHQRRQTSFQTIAQIEFVGELHRRGLSARIDVSQEARAASD